MDDHNRSSRGDTTKGNPNLCLLVTTPVKMKTNLISYYDTESSLGSFPWTPLWGGCWRLRFPKALPQGIPYLKRSPSALTRSSSSWWSRNDSHVTRHRSYLTLHVRSAFSLLLDGWIHPPLGSVVFMPLGSLGVFSTLPCMIPSLRDKQIWFP
jgi:hypothetical protein